MAMLKDRVVIVTGAGRGIGRDFALCMAAQGAKVVVNDPGVGADGLGHDDGPAAQVVEEIRKAGGTAVANTDSVAEWESANRIVKTAVDAFGTVHAVVNNAGILRDRIFHNMSIDEWHAVINVHLHGSFYMAKAVASIFKSEERGAFVREGAVHEVPNRALSVRVEVDEHVAAEDHVAAVDGRRCVHQIEGLKAYAVAHAVAHALVARVALVGGREKTGEAWR